MERGRYVSAVEGEGERERERERGGGVDTHTHSPVVSRQRSVPVELQLHGWRYEEN